MLLLFILYNVRTETNIEWYKSLYSFPKVVRILATSNVKTILVKPKGELDHKKL